MKKLSDKHRLFAHEVVKPGASATSAYRAVYVGVAQRTAAVEGSKLLRKPDVASLVADLREKQIARVDSRADQVLRRIQEAAELDPAQLFDQGGNVKSIHDMPLAVRRALVSMETEEVGEGKRRVKVRWRDPMKGDELLAKHHGLLRDIVEVKREFDLEAVTDAEWETLTALQHKVRSQGEEPDSE